jgi:hypothetical protein
MVANYFVVYGWLSWFLKLKRGNMRSRQCLVIVVFGLLITCLCFVSCTEKKKEGKVIVTESEFVVRQDRKGDKAFTIDAKGKVKNVGEVDVKQLVITGYCRSCGLLINPGNWFVSDIEKTPEQKDTISYLAVGDEEEFNFKGVAYIYNMVPEMPETIPETMEIVIESFVTVD